MTEDEMVGWHHRVKGHEFEQTLGDGEAPGHLVFGSPGISVKSKVLRVYIKHLIIVRFTM